MSRLSEIPKYKNKILELLMGNDNIVKALGNNDINFLDTASISNPKDLLFENIFPYCFVPEPEDEQKTYITLMFQCRGGKFYYKIGTIGFYIFSHNDLLKTNYPEMRTDYIVNQIDTLFHENQNFGLGELQFSKRDDIKVTKYHSGIYLEYHNLSFD